MEASTLNRSMDGSPVGLGRGISCGSPDAGRCLDVVVGVCENVVLMDSIFSSLVGSKGIS